ncbi:type VII secretion protein EccB [Nocardia otitidiscaviarum]|uniref:type VII secretion protein EccB n=1 Tax=Nocardia otitidiscaviarum TaxID=1823 RepID=UPI0004A7065E|nr:type VII secretion protein EccB [Nocardia otitidiscaviarum]MBF6133794.1 type VII secretion protein EccB [Nocardia otitidiscaviarum]MBF6487822.1 type VII secretion protein EccB [Nocardia otitidiscaviarum]
MPAQLTTRAQVNGYRFLLRRLDHALIRRDVRMLHDPMRAQFRSLIVGAVLAVLVVAGAAIMAFIRPQGSIGDANIVMGKESGALYVIVQDENDENKKTLHPVLNLASARLIMGSSESPKSVKDNKLNTLPRGPMLGIPGAPAALPGSSQGDRSEWTLCDTVQLSASGGAMSSPGATTTAIAGRLELTNRMTKAADNAALLVRSGDKTYLLYDGKRAEVDPANSVMKRSLVLPDEPPRPISTGLLGAATEVPPLMPPVIDRGGEPGPGRLSNIPIGGVIRVSSLDGSDKSDLYVVLADGVQQVSEFAARVIRNADSREMNQIPVLPPDMLDGISTIHSLPVDDFPSEVPTIIAARDHPVACINWSKAGGTGVQQADSTEGPADRSTVTVLTGTRLPLSESSTPVALATADQTGDRIDNVYIPPTTGEFVRVTGVEPGSQRRDSLFYVADNGIRYGVPDLDTAAVLGLGSTPHLAPWAIVGQLVPGPTLSKQDALVSRDSLSTGD